MLTSKVGQNTPYIASRITILTKGRFEIHVQREGVVKSCNFFIVWLSNNEFHWKIENKLIKLIDHLFNYFL